MQDYFRNFGIYLHVPFCAQNCDYCRFYKKIPSRSDIAQYLDSVKKEIKIHEEENKAPLPQPQTMFWGGGTPSCLSPDDIKQLAEILEPLHPSIEWTVEVAPSSATTERLRVLKEIGVTRISMGVQSFNPKTLSELGRKHSLPQTLNAIDNINSLEFPHFSIDLIFGAKNQTAYEWNDDIIKAANQPVDHISAYCLEFESGTSNCCGKGTEIERNREADFYEIVSNALPSLGFKQYEISNYSKIGCECIHNLSTWHMAQWLGLGPAAASQWKTLRRRNTPSFEKWTKSIIAKAPLYEDIVYLDQEELLSSSIIFGLRMNKGINLNDLSQRFPNANIEKYSQTLSELSSHKLITIKNNSEIKLTPEGRLLADAIAVELL